MFIGLKQVLVWANQLYMIFVASNDSNSVCFDAISYCENLKSTFAFVWASTAHKFSPAKMEFLLVSVASWLPRYQDRTQPRSAQVLWVSVIWFWHRWPRKIEIFLQIDVKSISSSSLRIPKLLSSNIWLKQTLPMIPGLQSRTKLDLEFLPSNTYFPMI